MSHNNFWAVYWKNDTALFRLSQKKGCAILRPARLRVAAVFIAITLIVFACVPAVGAKTTAPHIHSPQIIAAIKRGVNYLLKHESPGTFWEQTTLNGPPGLSGPEVFRGGETSLVMEALINVQQSLHLSRLNIYNPKMRSALKYLETIKPESTYAASFQANVFTLLPHKSEYLKVLRWDERYLYLTHSGLKHFQRSEKPRSSAY